MTQMRQPLKAVYSASLYFSPVHDICSINIAARGEVNFIPKTGTESGKKRRSRQSLQRLLATMGVPESK